MICIPYPSLPIASAIYSAVYWLAPKEERQKMMAITCTASVISAAAGAFYLTANALLMGAGTPFNESIPISIPDLGAYTVSKMAQFTFEGMKIGAMLSSMTATLNYAGNFFHQVWSS